MATVADTRTMVNGRYEPGNGTSYALAALRVEPGDWPGTSGTALPVIVNMEHARAAVFDLGPGTLHSNYIADRLRVGFCDGAAIVRWLEGFPGAEFTAVIGCECNRHG